MNIEPLSLSDKLAKKLAREWHLLDLQTRYKSIQEIVSRCSTKQQLYQLLAGNGIAIAEDGISWFEVNRLALPKNYFKLASQHQAMVSASQAIVSIDTSFLSS